MPEGLLLASASPRRVALLRDLGVDFTVRPSSIEEVRRPGEDVVCFARRAAREKAEAVVEANRGAWVMGADTVVIADGEYLGKPRDGDDACRMLRLLSGRCHRVVTAVVLVAPGGLGGDELAVETLVEFRPLSDEEIAAYVASGEPFDKAGAYGIQGGAGAFVRRVEGSYTNVIGLPLDEVRTLLIRHRLLDPVRNPEVPAHLPRKNP
jgi:nucleoside triphosphate pyrophosphatase